MTILFVYDREGRLILETEAGAEGAGREYLHRGDNRLAMYDRTGNAWYFFQNDHIGTPVAVTDADNRIVWEAVYLPCGEAAVNPASLIEFNLRFAGQYYDAETGLHYNYHRYYDPRTGRYLTPDPIGLQGGINLYGYVQNDPVNLTDPSGLRIQLMGTPEQQQYTLSQLGKFIRGNLSIENDGMLSRSPCEGDEGIESLADELISSNNLYKIYDYLYTNGTGRAQSVPTAYGGDIYFDPNVDANYFTGPFSQSPITPAAELAHELLGRGIQFERGEPHGRYGSRERDESNRRAMERANPAFIRMRMKPRFRYN